MTRLNEVAIRQLFGGTTEEPTTGTGTAGATNDLPDMNFRWGTISAAAPDDSVEVEVLLDGDAEPVPVGPNCLINKPALGQRVWCQLWGRRVIVLGAPGGSGWFTGMPWAMASGQITVTSNPAGSTIATPVTFPVGRFVGGSPIRVMVTPNTSVPTAVRVSMGSATPTGFTLYFSRTDTTGTSVPWIAMQGLG